jgi:hypothetical protein
MAERALLAIPCIAYRNNKLIRELTTGAPAAVRLAAIRGTPNPVFSPPAARSLVFVGMSSSSSLHYTLQRQMKVRKQRDMNGYHAYILTDREERRLRPSFF